MGGGYSPWNDAKANCLITFGSCFGGCILAEYYFLLHYASTDARPRLKLFRLWMRLVWYTVTTIMGLIFIILDLIDDKPKVENLDYPYNSYPRIAFAFAIGGFFLYEIACQTESRTCFNFVHHGGLISTVLMLPEYYTVLVWFIALNEAPGVIDLVGVIFLSRCGECSEIDKCNDCEMQKIKAMRLAMILRTCYLPVSLIPIFLLLLDHKGEFKIGPAMIIIGGVTVHWFYYGCYMSALVPKLVAKEQAAMAESAAGEAEALLSGGLTKHDPLQTDTVLWPKPESTDAEDPSAARPNCFLATDEDGLDRVDLNGRGCPLSNICPVTASEPITDTWRKSAYDQMREGGM